MEFAPTALGAMCALHADEVAQGICARCGNFMCATCDTGGGDATTTCPNCRELTQVADFPFHRGDYSLDRVLGYCWGHFKREWLMLSVALLVFLAILFGVMLLMTIFQTVARAISEPAWVGMLVLSQLIQQVTTLSLLGGLGTLFLGVMRGRPADLGKLFSQFGRLGTYAGAFLLSMGVLLLALSPLVALGLGILATKGIAGIQNTSPWLIAAAVLLSFVPMMWVGLATAFIPFEIAVGGARSPLEAVKRSFTLVSGHRLSAFGFLVIGGLIYLCGVLAACVGIFPGYALGLMLFFGLYLALRNGSGLPPMNADQ